MTEQLTREKILALQPGTRCVGGGENLRRKQSRYKMVAIYRNFRSMGSGGRAEREMCV